MTMRYVCWHPLLTDHQAHTYAAMQALGGGLVVNVGRVDDAVREAQGWVREGAGIVEERLIPARGWRQWARAELDRYPDAVHVFGSPFENTRQIRIMAMACRLGRKIAIISEPFSPTGVSYLSARIGIRDRLKAKLRPVVYKVYGMLFARRWHVVFAISPLACRQFEQMGVNAARIFPFGYFVPPINDAPPAPVARAVKSLRLVFVGSLIPRKGLAIAIEAVRRLRGEDRGVTLDVYGAGDPERYGVSEGVHFHGVTPFGRAGGVIAGYDALLLPSLFDGWGVVVNEALQTGTPVCCSDAVGAGAVVGAHDAGAVFASGSVGDLVRILRLWCDDPGQLEAARRGASQVAPLLAPDVAASYIDLAMDGVDGAGARPQAPWYRWPGERNRP